MEKVIVNVGWAEKNFCATFGENVPGAVVLTSSSWDGLMKEAKETLDFHVEGLVEDGDDVPQWLVDGDYELEFKCVDTAALLQSLGQYASLAAISHATGINQNLLSHYANGMKNPRPQQRQRILEGIHNIGARLMAVAL